MEFNTACHQNITILCYAFMKFRIKFEDSNCILIIKVLFENVIIQNAVSVFIRLGFAFKKGADDTAEYHLSWRIDPSAQTLSQPHLAEQELEVELSGLVMENISCINPSIASSSQTSSTSFSSIFPEFSNSSKYTCTKHVWLYN